MSKVKSYRETLTALNIVFGHYDIDFLKSLDISQYEDLFKQDSNNNPLKHQQYDLQFDRINFTLIKKWLTSS